MMLLKLLLAVVAVTMAGCSTAPKTALPFSEDLLGRPDDRTAVLVIYRDLVPPLAYDVRVDVDGRRITQLPNEAFTWVHVAPGTRTVDLSWPFIAATAGDTQTIPVEAGRYYFLAVGGGIDSFMPNSFGGTVTMSTRAGLQSYEEGVEALKACCRYVPAVSSSTRWSRVGERKRPRGSRGLFR